MPYRKIVFANQEIYHVVNRGVAKKPIFTGAKDYQRALEIIDYYRYPNPPLRFSFYNRLPKREKQNFIEKLKKENKPLVEIIAFCLMPNHMHFLLKQLQKKGTPTFMRNFQNSYARYFNTKYDRIGPLFQSMFKAVRIETDEQLLHVSRYIHLNPVSSYLIEVEDLFGYPWSSFPEYVRVQPPKLVATDLILGYFKTKEDYGKFIFDQADYQRELEKIKHLILE